MNARNSESAGLEQTGDAIYKMMSILFRDFTRILDSGQKIMVVLSIGLLISAAISSAFPITRGQTGIVRDFYLAVEYNLGGPGYDVFFTQTLVVEQNDQINITVRNAGTESFHLEIDGQPTVTILPGAQNSTGITPADTLIPVFTASAPGIFDFQTSEHPELSGQIVVLPSTITSYSPSNKTRNFTELVFADFAGTGYDKFFPGLMVVNQGDTVNVTIINTDDMPHGFAIAAYQINAGIDPGQDLQNGSIAPVTTSLQPFNASIPGIFRFLCTTPCGPGHFEMVGALIVLPTAGEAYDPVPKTTYSYLTVKPNLDGGGLDKYVPDTIFANENDLVYIKVTNTDIMNHSFSLPDFQISNQTVTAAQNTTTGLVPTDTYITAFFADQPGVHQFFCTLNCGLGPNQMSGYLVVLPSQNATTTSGAAAPQTMPLFILLLLSAALLVAGILIGVVIAVKFKEKV